MLSRLRLRSSMSDQLILPSYNLASVSRRAFPVSAAFLWNSHTAHLTSAPSLTVFRQCLKTFLFRRSCVDLITLRAYILLWTSLTCQHQPQLTAFKCYKWKTCLKALQSVSFCSIHLPRIRLVWSLFPCSHQTRYPLILPEMHVSSV